MEILQGFYILLFILGGIYLLYQKGYAVLSVKSALMHIGSMGIFKNEAKGYGKRCNGYTRRVFKVKESGRYGFSLEGQMEKGSVFGEVLDAGKEPVLSIDTQGQAEVYLTKGERYYLQIRYKGFSGKYVLGWQGEKDRDRKRGSVQNRGEHISS